MRKDSATWEYRVTYPAPDVRGNAKVEEWLCEMGSDGWELVGLDWAAHQEAGRRYVFKRRMEVARW